MKLRASKIIEVILKEKKWSKATLGRAVGITTETGTGRENKSKPTDVINKRLKQDNISIDMVAEMVEKMGYKVLIVPDGVTVKKDWYEVVRTDDVDGDDNE